MNLYDVAISTYEATTSRPERAEAKRLALLSEILARPPVELMRCLERIERDQADDADLVATELRDEIALMKSRLRELSLH